MTPHPLSYLHVCALCAHVFLKDFRRMKNIVSLTCRFCFHLTRERERERETETERDRERDRDRERGVGEVKE